MTDYEHDFNQWLQRVNPESIPNGVVAFVFNLSEGDNTFGVQFVGTYNVKHQQTDIVRGEYATPIEYDCYEGAFYEH